MIPVTKVFFPPKQVYEKYISEIWDSQWLTNDGPLLQKLENRLKNLLDINHLLIMTNGTIPIQIAIKVLANGGEVITTPFSYVATTASIIWENCQPVFVDIDPQNLTIDENKIEEKITPKTKAILATHVFGNPCDVEKIEKIAKKYKLIVIYDAAHAFGVNYKGISLLKYGDISTCSFHATKIFHTGEGGALIINNENLYSKLFFRHSFGHKGKEDYYGLGINGKMNELSAAMGLSVLPFMKEIIQKRKEICEYYDNKLIFKNFRGLSFRVEASRNYSYYPIILDSEKTLKELVASLKINNVYPRRYFYPSLDTLNYLSGQEICEVSRDISSRIICLPVYHDLTFKEVEFISSKINNFFK
jgi:dTDP-4-amino-4,6-dideoxygalactose transaminase